MDLSIANVINVSVSQAGQGIGEYNTSNLAIFSHESYETSFGTDGYKIYLEPTEVATDFGTASQTYKEALAIFSQRPNILTNGGYLVIIPMIAESQTIIFDGIAVSGTYELNFDGDIVTGVPFDADAAALQILVRQLTGLEGAIVTGVAQNFVVDMSGYGGDAPLMTVTTNTMVDGGAGPVAPVIAESVATETIGAAITRTQGLVQYFGVMGTEIYAQAEVLAGAAVLEAIDKIGLFVSKTEADIDPGGTLDLLRSGGFSHSRALYYEGADDSEALVMMASYAGRAFSTNFSGSNTTQSMHLKDLQGVQPDPQMTQTKLLKAVAAGADTYSSFQGTAKVFCSGENSFFDQVYNLLWFIGALKVVGFNILAQTSTKIVQTEDGVSVLKSAYRGVCEQAITNQYSAPGTWTSPNTFGDLADLISNVSQRGYYIYSSPVSQQSAADRALRKAPLVQIALKEAGAIHSASIIVNVNQ